VASLQPYAERVRKRRAALERGLRRFLETCRNDATVLAVYVHGSFASGNIGPTSDLDLLVIRRTSLSRSERYVDLVLAARAGIPLDVLVVTPEEFASKLPLTTYGATLLATIRRVDAA